MIAGAHDLELVLVVFRAGFARESLEFCSCRECTRVRRDSSTAVIPEDVVAEAIGTLLNGVKEMNESSKYR